MAEVHLRDGMSRGLELADRLGDRAVGAAPADEEQLALRGAEDLERRDLAHHPGDLAGAHADHLLVVPRCVADVAREVLLLEAADPVLEPRRAGDDPGTRKRLLIPQVRIEAARVR